MSTDLCMRETTGTKCRTNKDGRHIEIRTTKVGDDELDKGVCCPLSL